MMTSVVFYSYILTVIHLLWLMNDRRNRINLFSSSCLFAEIILTFLRGQSVWFWRKHRTWGFLYRLIFHLDLLYHSSWVFILVIYRFFLLIIVWVWHFLSSDLTFFTLLEINTLKVRYKWTHTTQCMWGVLDPPVSVFGLSLYQHPSICIFFISDYMLDRTVFYGQHPHQGWSFTVFSLALVLSLNNKHQPYTKVFYHDL
jgi:hypothetical protein